MMISVAAMIQAGKHLYNTNISMYDDEIRKYLLYGGSEGQNTTTLGITIEHFRKPFRKHNNIKLFNHKQEHCSSFSIMWNVVVFPEMLLCFDFQLLSLLLHENHV